VKRACVIGWPVAHSRSPVIHRYWLKLYGLDGAYELEAVRPEEIEDFLHSLRERGYQGANVTLPHKEAALAAADRPDEAATAIGAANTLWLDAGGLLHASNTDAYGFMTHLSAETPDWNKGGRPVMVLGAGGAARAILYGLLEAGRRQDPARQPHGRPGEGLGGGLRQPGASDPLGGAEHGARRVRAPGQRHEPRHDRKAAPRY
jgi:shikimate dehydrogenase